MTTIPVSASEMIGDTTEMIETLRTLLAIEGERADALKEAGRVGRRPVAHLSGEPPHRPGERQGQPPELPPAPRRPRAADVRSAAATAVRAHPEPPRCRVRE